MLGDNNDVTEILVRRGNAAAADLAALFGASASPDVGSLPDQQTRKRKHRATLVEAGQ